MRITPLIKEARSIVYNNLNYSLNQLNAAGQLKIIRLEDLSKFKLQNEAQLFDSYQCKLQYKTKSITVFIRNICDPQGAVIVSLDDQAA